MDFYSMTDKAICEEFGLRVKSLRLKQNKTQQELADAVQLSLSTIKNIESGNGKIINFISVLRELQAFNSLDNFIPEITISPLQLAKMQGVQRQRASGKKIKNDEEDSEW